MWGVIRMDQPPPTPPKNRARIVRETDWSICRIRYSGTDALPPEGDSRGARGNGPGYGGSVSHPDKVRLF